MTLQQEPISALALDREQPYRHFAWGVLGKRVRSLRKRLKKLRATGDAQAIHRTRVASRRLRTSLELFADALPVRRLKAWSKPIRKLAQRLGRARDTDVQLELVSRLLAEEPPLRVRPGLERLRLRLNQRRHKHTRRMTKAIQKLEDSGALGDLHRLLRRKLDRTALMSDVTAPTIPDASPGPATPVTPATDAGDAHLQPLAEAAKAGQEGPRPAPPLSPLGHAQSALIARHAAPALLARLDKLLSYAPVVYQPEEVERLHEMRIAAKHLRYALEMFTPVLGPAVRPAAEAASHLQQVLGEVHDADMWAQELPEFLEKETRRTVEHLGRDRSMGRIRPGIEFLRRRQAEHRELQYRAFVASWDDKMQRGLWGELRSLLEAAAETLPTASDWEV